VQFNSGCLFTRVYYLEIGKPTISLNTAATTACDPGTYSLSFNDQSPGVQYTIYWDYINNPTIVNQYTYPNFPIFPQTVNHSFPFAPCTGTPATAPARTIKIKAVNSCGETFPSAATIFVNKKPEAGFTMSTNDVICQGTSVSFNDTSYSGVYVDAASNNLCSNVHKRAWLFSPSISSPNALTGTTGVYQGTNGTPNINVTFNTPGNYSIGLIAYNDACEPDTTFKTICVVPTVQAGFNASTPSGCKDLAVTTINTSSLPGCSGLNMLYNWTVTSANSLNCGTSAWSFAGSSNSTSSQPAFNFTGPGTYTVTLTSSLNPPVPGAQCTNSSFSRTITVQDKPQITLPPPSAICQGGSFSPSVTVNDCYNNTPTYTWVFNGGTPGSAALLNQLNPGNITYSAFSNGYNYSLTAVNSCGSTTANQTIVVNQPAIVQPGSYSLTCSGGSIPLSGSVSGSVSTGVWSTTSGGYFQPNPQALNATYVPPAGAVGNIVLTLTSATPPSPCPVVSVPTNINLSGTPIVNAGNDTSICAGSLVNLHGTYGGTATSVTWTTLGTGTFSNQTNPITNYVPSALDLQNGSVNLVITTNNPAGPCNEARDTVHVIFKPIPTLTIGTSPSVCSGNPFSLSLTPSITNLPASYNWTLIAPIPLPTGAQVTGTILPPNNSFSTSVINNTNGSIQLTYAFTTTINGCTSIPFNRIVTINPLPLPVITPNGPTSICQGSSLTLTTSSFSSYLSISLNLVSFIVVVIMCIFHLMIANFAR
jgi:hypothetical protein